MKSIRTQFFSIISVLLLILLILLNTLPITSARDMAFAEKKNSMSGQAAVLASSLESLEKLNARGVSEVLKLLDSSFARTVVTDASGSVVFDDASGSYQNTDDTAEALKGQAVFRSHFTAEAFYSSYTMPLYSGSTLIGTLRISETDSARSELVLNLQNRILTISVIIVLAAIAVTFLFTSVLVNRIRDLVRSIRIVAGGDYSHRHAPRGQDEITELCNEFNTLTERLQVNEQQHRRFVADASHELKTPLASIRLLSDSIVESKNMDPETMRDFVTDIGTEAHRLQRTTEKLLDLSRLDDGVQVQTEPVDIGRVTEDAIEMLKPLAEERSIRMEPQMDEGCVVMATADGMYHIVFNLIENAIKYNEDGGLIQIRLTEEDNNVRFSVADTGIGIPEEERLAIFTRFYRVDKARSRETGGSGLGLSIVHDAVIQYGGTITVGANRPRGSVFIVSFPKPTEKETGI